MIRVSRFIPVAILIVIACREKAPDGIALLGATLIDGTGGPPLQDAVVVVRRGKIESIGSRRGFTLPGRTRELNLSGRWVVPGLIDAHVHLASASDWAPARFLAWGVTTVRDVHGSLNAALTVRKRLNGDRPAGPRVYTAGAMIDGIPPGQPDAVGVAGEQEARKAVDRLVTAGTDLVKVYTRIDPLVLRAIIDEARAFDLRVAGHLGMTDAVTAAHAGISSIEHLSGVPEAAGANRSGLAAAHYRGLLPGWTAFERSWPDLDSASLTRVAAQLAEAKVSVVPTLVLHDVLGRLNDPELLQDPALKEVPENVRREWDVPGTISRADWTERDFDVFRRSRQAQNFFLQAFARAGGRIAGGTDAPNLLLIPGYSQHREMELLVGAGLTPREALRAATRNGAVLLGIDSIGLLAPGKVADLLVLSKDPLADIRNTRQIEAVMSHGYLLDPDSIRASW